MAGTEKEREDEAELARARVERASGQAQGAVGGLVATEHLRQYAAWLDGRALHVTGMKQRLATGGMTTGDWGVWGAKLAFHSEDMETPYEMFAGEAPPEVKAFRAALERAHEATGSRLQELHDVIRETAHGLRSIADDYDETRAENIRKINHVGE